jgi:hypothetical protein
LLVVHVSNLNDGHSAQRPTPGFLIRWNAIAAIP